MTAIALQVVASTVERWVRCGNFAASPSICESRHKGERRLALGLGHADRVIGDERPRPGG